jgi:AcrR family transcriptional regulator
VYKTLVGSEVSSSKFARQPPRVFEPPPLPKPTKGERTRRRLLDIAAQMFVEQGYFAVSIRDIAAKADLTNGAVYGHFRTKGQLLVEVIRWKMAERDEMIDFAAASDPARGIDLLYDGLGRDLRLLEVDAAAAARHDADVMAGLSTLYKERLARTERVIGNGVPDPKALAWFISTLGAGIGMREAAGMASPGTKRKRETIFAAFGDIFHLPR